ncbi:autophagy-related protein 11-domain-containing protein [Apiospora phragmitis]|uniref:Autophagy-related protein 11 n=1 Tax=Apiospora phragmitis TaxID=2905665 RepID=A0ABR1VFT9_9PEZI
MATRTQVLIAHTGQRLQVDISQFATLYIYDIRIIQASTTGTPASLVSQEPLPKRYNISAAPNSLTDTRSLQSWHELFKSRRDWALTVLEDCTAMVEAAQARHGEMDVMVKCLDAAVANLETAVRPIEPKYKELKDWVTPTQEDYNSLANNWERLLEIARSVNISPAMVRFMTGRETRKSRQATLEDLIDLDTTRKAGKLANTSLRKFNSKVSELDKTAAKMFDGCDDLFQEFEKVMSRSALQRNNESVQLLEDIEAVAKKIDTDYEATLNYSSTTRDLLQASKTAANHTERLLPSIRARSQEMDEMLRYATEARNGLASGSLIFMRTIAEITSLHHNLKTKMTLLNQGEEEMTTFDYLRLIQQLPFMYASFVAEAVRRREWQDKVKTDSSTLANEMALFQDEELKRRRKFQKVVGNTYGPDKNDTVLGLEVNLLGDEDTWPAVTKRDLEDFMTEVQQQGVDDNMVEEVAKIVKELNSPTKQQAKRLKAFKNGSVHEAALGRSGLMIRGDDDLFRTLQDDKVKLENKLKTAESRVRRLEGLLHRQSTPAMGSLFQPGGQNERSDSAAPLKSPRASESRRGSTTSEANGALLNRIAQLEGELKAEQEQSALFKEAAGRAKEIEGQMDEVNSTKKDLLGNMEALKREFMEERKSLEEEIKTLKARLEETEDEIEHFGESRENEKVTYDDKLRSLEDEVERLTQEKQDEALKTQGQAEYLRNEARIQIQRNEELERQLQEARESVKDLTSRAETSEQNSQLHARTLRDLHGQMSPRDRVPEDINDLMEAVTNKSSEVLTKFKSLEEDMAILKSELEVAQHTIYDTKAELSTTKDTLSTEETTRMKLHEALDSEKAKSAALEGELKQSRDELHELRKKMTEGESGSETLRTELEDAEKRVAELTESLAARQSQRFEGRSDRTKDITQRLYTHNERLCRLLERLGFSVTRKDEEFTIQKIPRSERTARDPNDSSDPSSSIRRSVSWATAPMASSTDLKLLFWMNADDGDTEATQYQSFVKGPGFFDIDIFANTLYRRVKEAEHTARKMTRDARSYKERAHAAVKDAHDKIAFRHFKEGDLALFLPTRNQTTGAWAAFNVGCPHFFLREQESHRLRQREWLVARITRIQERVVDLSKSLSSTAAQLPLSETDSVNTGDEFDNPFDLSDGLRWWLIDAIEDKAGAPSTPGLGKSTVATNNVEARADMHTHQARSGASKLLSAGGDNAKMKAVSKTLSESLKTRRSSSGSSTRKNLPFAGGAGASAAKSSALASETNSLRAVPIAGGQAASEAGGQAGPAGSPFKARHDGGSSKTSLLSNAQVQDAEAGNADGGQGGNGNEQRLSLSPRRRHRPTPAPASASISASASARNTYFHPHPWERSNPQKATEPLPQLQRDMSNASSANADGPDQSVVWDELWSLDVSYPGQ